MKGIKLWTYAAAALSLAAANVGTASAQDEEYFNQAWWSCELTGNQTVWNIVRYKEGMSWFNESMSDRGTITFSDDCIEINCRNVMMHFPVAKYSKISDKIFSVTRLGEDDYFDYIEVVEGDGQRDKGTYRFMMAKLDEDGTMQNTHIFICKPKSYSTGKTAEDAMTKQGKSVGMPIQVRRLK